MEGVKLTVSLIIAIVLQWTLRNTSDAPARFHWIRKIYEAVPGIDES